MKALKRMMGWVLGATVVVASSGYAWGFANQESEPRLEEGPVLDVYQPVAAIPLGKILAVRGQVLVVHANAPERYWARTGLPLYRGDTLLTLTDGQIEGRLSDGSRFSLAPASMLVIKKGVFDQERKHRLGDFFLGAGKARFKVEDRDEFTRQEFKVQTGTAVVQTGASDFIVWASWTTTVVTALRNTQLEVMSTTDPTNIIALAEFQRTVVEQGETPSMVQAVSPEEVDQMISDFRYSPQLELSQPSGVRPESRSE
ncbi:MAG: FecR domain-containing protein [Desulfobacterales bacterium]|nr:MAG: FecR domain-containing protein [Desulfobacterales bacterium]